MRKKTLTGLVVLPMLSAATLLTTASLARAGLSAEQQCQKSRYDAAAKYAQCEGKALAQLFASNNLTKLQPALSKCRVKYTATWVKIQKKAIGTGSTCDTPRFVLGGIGADERTIIDNLTGLEWEKKTDDGSRTDKDDVYVWNGASRSDAGSGGFLAKLNNDGGAHSVCHSFTCDWRLPTVAELQTILSEEFPCTTSPCIDTDFGPTVANQDYWSSTTLADNPTYAWGVFFGTGEVSYGLKTDTNAVRAVRGGLF